MIQIHYIIDSKFNHLDIFTNLQLIFNVFSKQWIADWECSCEKHNGCIKMFGSVYNYKESREELEKLLE
jgi:hypothetical protein